MAKKSKDQIIEDMEDRIDQLEADNEELRATLDDICDAAQRAIEENPKKVFKTWDQAQRSQVASANAMGNLVGDIDEAYRIADMYTEDWVQEIGAKVLER